jgi:hypothetical protein
MHIKKNTGRLQINGQMLHLKLLKKKKEEEEERKEQAIPKTSRREVIKISAQISEIETKKTTQRIDERKSRFFQMINKIDKPLANLTKMRRKIA